MALIGKIRRNSALVIGVITVAIVAFMVGDAINNNMNLFRGGSGTRDVGTIYGEAVPWTEYDLMYNRAVDNQRMQMQGQEMTPMIRGYINDQVWDQYVQERILSREYAEMHFPITGTEIQTLFLPPYTHNFAQQVLASSGFIDQQTGQVNTAQLQQFWAGLDQQPLEVQQGWAEVEKQFSDLRRQEKYFALVSKALFVTDLEAGDDFAGQNASVSFQYVPLFLGSIADTTIEVSDSEIKNYFDEHKEDFKVEEMRGLKFVTFDIKANQADTAYMAERIRNDIKTLSRPGKDSLYVVRQGGTYSGFEPRGKFPAEVEDQLFNADSGAIIGPVLDNGAYKVLKVVNTRRDSVYYHRSSHILVKPDGPTAADTAKAMQEAEDLARQVRGGADFEQLAREKSEDPGSGQRGGEIGWFAGNTEEFVKPYRDAVVNMRYGEIRVVKSEFGIHVIKKTAEPSNKLVKAAIIERPVTAGGNTVDAVRQQAGAFRSSVSNEEEFQIQAQKIGKNVNIANEVRSSEKNIAGLADSREVIRWAFQEDRKEGDIFNETRIGDQMVVAILTRIQEEGYADIEDEATREQITSAVRQEKKKEMLADKLREAQKKNNSLEAIAKAVESSVNTASEVRFGAATVPNLGFEPKLVGAAFGAEVNKIVGPVQGQAGVFLLQVTQKDKAPEVETFTSERQAMQRQISSTARESIMRALRENADVKDYRYLFY